MRNWCNILDIQNYCYILDIYRRGGGNKLTDFGRRAQLILGGIII